MESKRKRNIFRQNSLAFQRTVFRRLKPGFHMIVTVSDASPRQARGHIGDSCVKRKHFLSDVSDVADQTETARGRIERVEMRSKPGFHMIITVIASMSPTDRGHVADVSQ